MARRRRRRIKILFLFLKRIFFCEFTDVGNTCPPLFLSKGEKIKK
jgi:hypothetical protein